MAVGFDASGDYARITANLPDVALFTICGFARLKTERNWQAIFSLDDANTHYLQLVLDDTTPTRNLRVSSSDGGDGAFASRPSNDTWFFFALTNKTGATETLYAYWTYLNPVSLVSFGSGFNNCADFAATGLYLGNDGYDDYGGLHLAHVRVWDAQLSSTELSAEAASATPVRLSDLRAYWPLANNTDTGDDSGNGFDLTFGGTLTSETSPSFGLTVALDTASITAQGQALADVVPGAVTIVLDTASITAQGQTATVSAGGTEGLTQHSFRFRNDDGDEDEATWKASLNTDITLPPGEIVRLRVLLDSVGDQDAGQYRLEYRKVGDTVWEVVE